MPFFKLLATEFLRQLCKLWKITQNVCASRKWSKERFWSLILAFLIRM